MVNQLLGHFRQCLRVPDIAARKHCYPGSELAVTATNVIDAIRYRLFGRASLIAMVGLAATVGVAIDFREQPLPSPADDNANEPEARPKVAIAHNVLVQPAFGDATVANRAPHPFLAPFAPASTPTALGREFTPIVRELPAVQFTGIDAFAASGGQLADTPLVFTTAEEAVATVPEAPPMARLPKIAPVAVILASADTPPLDVQMPEIIAVPILTAIDDSPPVIARLPKVAPVPQRLAENEVRKLEQIVPVSTFEAADEVAPPMPRLPKFAPATILAASEHPAVAMPDLAFASLSDFVPAVTAPIARLPKVAPPVVTAALEESAPPVARLPQVAFVAATPAPVTFSRRVPDFAIPAIVDAPAEDFGIRAGGEVMSAQAQPPVQPRAVAVAQIQISSAPASSCQGENSSCLQPELNVAPRSTVQQGLADMVRLAARVAPSLAPSSIQSADAGSDRSLVTRLPKPAF
jgi:hypothetical protein